jgi:L-ascorbate metabolism protein UlaG (beta-lactamase superfamily)
MRPAAAVLALALVLASACSLGRSIPRAPASAHAAGVVRRDARLAVTWVGHATMLVQIDDKLILTDPLLTDSVGQIQRRLQEPGLSLEEIPPLDAVVVSHMHFDHLSLGSLEMIEHKTPKVLVPQGGLVYVPDFAFDTQELARWESWEGAGGLRITAVPVDHVGYRYGVDDAWMTTSFTGYVFQYHGLAVYFAGDTAYARDDFEETHVRFPDLAVALLPIAPIHPRDFMKKVHMDPDEALRAFGDLGAREMIPMHFDTLVNSADDSGEARETLVRLARERHVEDRVHVLRIGEQRVVVGGAYGAAGTSQ